QAAAGISSAQAQLQQAQANLNMQQAMLDDLKDGNSTENIAVAETTLANAEKALLDLELELNNTEKLNVNSLALTYDGAIGSLEQILTTARESLYTLTDLQYEYFGSANTMDGVALVDAKSKAVESLLGVANGGRWVNQFLHTYCDGTCALISGLRNNVNYDDVDLALTKMIIAVRDLKAAYMVIPMDGTLSTADQIIVNTEKNTLDANITVLSGKQQSIALQKTTNGNTLSSVQARYNSAANAVQSATANLNLIKAGATEWQITAQEAAVAQASAAVDMQSAMLEQARAAYNIVAVNLEKYQLTAVFDGIVTERLAKVGESAAPQQILLTLMSTNQFELKASIRETDIDKLKVGNAVKVSFDALPNEEFIGDLIFIDPAESIQQGVIYYDVKVILKDENNNIDRLKSGMTADLDIVTATKEKAMYLPMGVVSYRGGKAYVKVLEEGEVKEIEIETGIESGRYVELVNTLKPGDKVISVIID
ncbi:MAG TPA: efflux RND transporter periplasmic adaptor subunit, partial [bacterium]|nr:efflux RND transporter periplasmic adaptor subunit [bacterium]